METNTNTAALLVSYHAGRTRAAAALALRIDRAKRLVTKIILANLMTAVQGI